MSESATTDADLDDEDLTQPDFDNLSAAAQIAWLRYAAVTLMKRDTMLRARVRWLILVASCAVLLGAVAIGLCAYTIFNTASRTDVRNAQYLYVRNQLRTLVCSIPPGDEARDALRAQAQCGPYQAPSSSAPGRSTPAPTGQPTATSTPTRSAASLPAQAAQPRVTVTAPRPGTSSRTGPVTRRTVTSVPQRRTTATATRPAPTAAPRTSPSTPPGLLPDVLCRVIGCTP